MSDACVEPFRRKNCYDKDLGLTNPEHLGVTDTGQVPCVAGLPFLMVIALASLISLLARHFTQYAHVLPPVSGYYAR